MRTPNKLSLFECALRLTLPLSLTFVAAADPLPLLTNVRQVVELDAGRAGHEYPVRVRAVVTFYSSKTGEFFIEDDTAGIYVDGVFQRTDLALGQMVEVSGVSQPGDFAPVIRATEVKVLGPGRLPEPKQVRYEQVAGGLSDSEWVEISGVVRSASISAFRPETDALVLRIDAGGGIITAAVYDFPRKNFDSWVDARVRLRGACGSYSNEGHQFLAVLIYVNSINDMQVLSAAPADPFSIALRPINGVLQFAAGAVGGRVKVAGTVTCNRPGHGVYIQDGSQAIFARTNQTSIEPGARIEVVGFGATGEYAPILEDASVRVAGIGRPVVPLKLTATEILGGGHEAQLARVEALLREQRRGSRELVLVLQDGEQIFNASLVDMATASGLAKLADGSKLALTGIVSIQADENRTPRSFRLLLRSPNDIAVLEKPSYWTLPHVLRALGLMVVLILAALVWVGLLRRRVRQQTEIIAERLRRESALQQQYSDLFYNASDMIYSRDLTGKMIAINPAGEQITGFSREEARHIDLLDLATGDQRDQAKEHFQRLLAGEAQPAFEIEIVSKDGRRVILEDNPRLILQDGSPVRVDSVARDITARKLAEEELRRSEEQLRLLATAVRSIDEGVMITDSRLPFPGPAILVVNEAFTALTGFTSADLAGKTPLILGGPKSPNFFLEALNQEATQGRFFTGEAIAYRKDGSEWLMEIDISPVVDSAGRVTHYVSIMRDVTERRQLEGQLRQAQKMEAIGVLAGGIAHDFNNLMTVILGYSKILKRRLADNQPLCDKVGEIERAGERAASLTEQLLTFSRRQMLQPQILDLNHVLRGIESMVRRLIREDIELIFEFDTALGKVRADRGQIEQVVMNLAVNARDAMPDGGRLTIRTSNAVLDAGHPGVQPGPFVRLSVTDSGHGMDEQTAGRIFEPFFTTKEPGKGTGLGLSMVYGIVEQSRGTLAVDSKPGLGATFHIYLPRVDGPSVPETKAEPVTAVHQGAGTILLVEDEPGVRELTREILTSSGYSVLTANDGAAALKLALQHQHFDLLLTDVVMPGLNGPELARQLLESTPDLKIIYISGYTDHPVIRDGNLNGAIFVRKPFAPDFLLQKVGELLAIPVGHK